MSAAPATMGYYVPERSYETYSSPWASFQGASSRSAQAPDPSKHQYTPDSDAHDSPISPSEAKPTTIPSQEQVDHQSHHSKNGQAFEFTKRKHWAELLVGELSECVIFVLSPTGKVWFCGNAVTELLGYRDEETVDRDLTSFMNEEDRAPFMDLFHTSISNRQDLHAYARIRSKAEFDPSTSFFGAYAQPAPPSTSRKEMLFEIRGYAHFPSYEDEEESEDDGPVHHPSSDSFPYAGYSAPRGGGYPGYNESPQPDGSQPLPETEACKCFFAMAKPYPSRNAAMMNVFFELKIENLRLQQRLDELRAAEPTPVQSQQSSFGPSFSSTMSTYGGLLTGLRRSFDEYSSTPSGVPQSTFDDDDGQDGAARKKAKRVHGMAETHVCVTCGRTDSPEWRKGPMGPKTLCNACGLRWAKQMRKVDKDKDGAGGEVDTAGG